MSNATDSHEAICAGFRELQARLAAMNEPPSSLRIEANAKAREMARNRVWNEYGALGLTPPSDDALSITARTEMGIAPLANMPAEEAAE